MKGRRRRPQRSMQLIRPDGHLLTLGCDCDQVYTFEAENGYQYHWAVAEAKRRAEAHSVLGEISLSDTGMTLDRIHQMYADLNEAHARTRDLTIPLIFVPFHGEHVLIDGWHRTYKALLTGVDILPCYFLSQEDADLSLIVALPPEMALGEGNGASENHL